MKDKEQYIVCFGEVLWDVYPDGKKLGGAPFNVAAHMNKLGLKAHIISKVGDDAYGKEIREAIHAQGISSKYTQLDDSLGTGVVDVVLDDKGKPSYTIKIPVAWDDIYANDENRTLLANTEAFVFGSLVCRTKQSRATLFELAGLSKLNICDLNIRQSFFDKKLIKALLEFAQILKINDEEAELLQELFDIEETNFYEQLSEQFSLDVIIQTLGANGAEAYSNGQLYTASGIKTNVIDTVGSGDSFLAAFIRNYLKGENISFCLKKGCELGSYVASKQGAIPEHPATKDSI